MNVNASGERSALSLIIPTSYYSIFSATESKQDFT